MLSRRAYLSAGGVTLFGAIAGCTYPEASANTVEFSGDIERVDGRFHMDGFVSISGTTRRNIDEVAVVLYARDRTVIERVSVGAVSSHSEGPYPTMSPVTITSARVPAYVIIESPDIRAERVPSEAFRLTRDGYYHHYCVEGEDERFPSE